MLTDINRIIQQAEANTMRLHDQKHRLTDILLLRGEELGKILTEKEILFTKLSTVNNDNKKLEKKKGWFSGFSNPGNF